MDQNCEQSASLKPEDIRKVIGALINVPVNNDAAQTQDELLNLDWSLLIHIAIDLGIPMKKMKSIKDCLQNRSLNVAFALSEILDDWVNRNGSSEKPWREQLISILSSNITQFSHDKRVDYVKLFKRLDTSLETVDEVSSKAWRIDLIREEIYKHLSILEKRNVRLVSKGWWKGSLLSWRKSVTLKIKQGKLPGSIYMRMLPYLYTLRNENGKDIYFLEDYPFESFSLNEATITLPQDHGWSESSRFFWYNCAHNIVSLTLENCTFTRGHFLETFKWIVTQASPQIKYLELRNCNQRKFGQENTKTEEAPTSDVGLFAKKLKTLKLLQGFVIPESENAKFLELTPYIENLVVDNMGVLEGLLNVTLSGDIIKLNTLEISAKDNLYEPFNELKLYTKQNPPALQHLKINGLNFKRGLSVRAPPYNFYSTIFNCSKTLSSLELSILTCERNLQWVIELSTIPFPNLKKFKLFFEKNEQALEDYMKFDFGTLKMMPKLESFEIRYDNLPRDFRRQNGLDDWIYLGDRNQFIPEGIVIREGLFEDPLVLRMEHLKEFIFNGWPVNLADLELFREWLPSLKSLAVAIEENIRVDALLNTFRSLNSVTLNSGSKVHQDEICIAKLKHDGIRIFQDVPNFGKIEALKGEGAHQIVFSPSELNQTEDVTLNVLSNSSIN